MCRYFVRPSENLNLWYNQSVLGSGRLSPRREDKTIRTEGGVFTGTQVCLVARGGTAATDAHSSFLVYPLHCGENAAAAAGHRVESLTMQLVPRIFGHCADFRPNFHWFQLTAISHSHSKKMLSIIIQDLQSHGPPLEVCKTPFLEFCYPRHKSHSKSLNQYQCNSRNSHKLRNSHNQCNSCNLRNSHNTNQA